MRQRAEARSDGNTAVSELLMKPTRPFHIIQSHHAPGANQNAVQAHSARLFSTRTLTSTVEADECDVDTQ